MLAAAIALAALALALAVPAHAHAALSWSAPFSVYDGVDEHEDLTGLVAVSCPSTTQCTSVSNVVEDGQEVTFDPLSPTKPSPATVDDLAGALRPQMSTVACPSTSECTAGDRSGRVVTFNPASPGAPTPHMVASGLEEGNLSCPAENQCTVVVSPSGEVSKEATFEPAAPASPAPSPITTSESPELDGLSCPTLEQCTAIDRNGWGPELTFDPTAPAASEPTEVIAETYGFDAISCPSASQCTAIGIPYKGEAVEVTFDPASPASVSSAVLAGTDVVGRSIACPSVTQCTAVGGEDALTFNPRSPGTPSASAIDPGGYLQSVSCPIESQCTAVDVEGREVTAAAGSGISGQVLDSKGVAMPEVTVTLTGTTTSGEAVSEQTSTDAGGNYAFSLAAGTYTVAPVQPSEPSQGRFVSTACSGARQAQACQITLSDAEPHGTANFRNDLLIVNTTATGFDQTEAEGGICDVTPTAASQTCTLPQALAAADSIGGGTIRFDIPEGEGNAFDGAVPKILPGGALPDIRVPVTIDGTSQPGAGKVEISGAANAVQFGLYFESAGGNGSVVRGLVINRFPDGIGIFGADVAVEGNLIGTDPSGREALPASFAAPWSDGLGAGIFIVHANGTRIGGPSPGQGNVISGNIETGIRSEGTSDATVQGNTIGPALGGGQLLLPAQVLTDAGVENVQRTAVDFIPLSERNVPGEHNTIGGASATSGNLLAGGTSVTGDGNVFQGNTIASGGGLRVEGAVTVGGASATPGAPPGNSFTDTGIVVRGAGAVLQGNSLRGESGDGDEGIFLENAEHVTIGGGTAALGNLIEQNPSLRRFTQGVEIERSSEDPYAKNLVENNTIRGFPGSGIEIDYATGNDITQNHMSDDGLGIELGSEGFFYNPLASTYTPDGANNLEEYPLILSAKEQHGSTDVTLGLEAPPDAASGPYEIELYEQPTCDEDSITPGEGARSLGLRAVSPDGLKPVNLSFDAASGAVTATATAPNGSTSEFSPCLAIGHRASSFVGDGVTLPDKTVTTTSATASAARASAKHKPDAKRKPGAKHKPSATGKHATKLATLRPFCPPATKRYCQGVAVLAASPHGKALAHFTFKLAPGELGTVKLRLPATLARRLARAHHLKLTLTIRARDGAKHPHRKRTVERVTLV